MDAATGIGTSLGVEDKLEPKTIADKLPPNAAALRDILTDPRVTNLSADRINASRDAGSAQKNYRLYSKIAVVGGAIAALASGVLLYGSGGDASEQDAARSMIDWAAAHHQGIAVVQIGGLLAAAFASAYLAQMNFAGKWEAARRDAEAGRIAIANRVLDLASADPGTGPGGQLRQALEFFRRYQLEYQIAFYESRGGQYGRAYARVAFFFAALAGLGAILGSLGGLGGTFMVVAAFLGIAVPILLSAAQSWTATSRADEVATTYKATARALRAIAGELSDVRKRADLADVAEVRAFAERVHQVMRGEQAGWKPVGDSGKPNG